MKARQKIIMLVLGALALSIAGCATIVDAGAASVAYVRGDLQATLQTDINTAYNAAVKAVDKLELAVISKKKNALDAQIISRTAKDKKVRITLERTEADAAALSIRIGLIGDEMQSRLILDQIKKNI